MATEAQAGEIITLLKSIDKKLGTGGASTGGAVTAGAAATSGAGLSRVTVTREMALAAVTAVRDKLGPAASKKLVLEQGGAKSFDGVDKKKYAAMLKEAERLLPAEDEPEPEEPEVEDDGL